MISEPHPDELEPYERDGATLHCTGCDEYFQIPSEWLDAHAGEHVGCPGCGLSRAIPVES